MPPETPGPGGPGPGGGTSSSDDDLVFAAEDLRGDASPPAPTFDDAVTFAATPRAGDAARPVRPAPPVPAPAVGKGFQVFSSAQAPAVRAEPELPWTVRESAPVQPSRRGWNTRQSGSVERSATDTLRRLREDAVHVSWTSAWIAVNTIAGRPVQLPDY